MAAAILEKHSDPASASSPPFFHPVLFGRVPVFRTRDLKRNGPATTSGPAHGAFCTCTSQLAAWPGPSYICQYSYSAARMGHGSKLSSIVQPEGMGKRAAQDHGYCFAVVPLLGQARPGQAWRSRRAPSPQNSTSSCLVKLCPNRLRLRPVIVIRRFSDGTASSWTETLF